MKDTTRSVDTEDRCTLGRYVKDAKRSVDTEDWCTLGRYVKDATMSRYWRLMYTWSLCKRRHVSSGVVSFLPTVTTPFCLGAHVKHQQPISVIIEMLHYICLPDLTFQSDSSQLCQYNHLKLIQIGSYKLITVNSYFMNQSNTRMTS